MTRPEVISDWADVLDRLEQHVALTEQVVSDQIVTIPEPWTPPTGLAPIPDVFLARARNLLARQQALIDVIPSMMEATNEQRRVVHRITEATTNARGPVYFDVAT